MRLLHLLTPDLEDAKRAELQKKLENIIDKVLRIHPRLHYVQVLPPPERCIANKGFHDIAEVLLLIYDGEEDLSCKLLHRLSLINIRGN
jgi:hypothetical protein